MFKKTSLFLVMAFSCIGFSQNEDLFKRLRAIENNNITFYNVDGLAFTKEAIPSHFNEKNLKKAYRKYGIKKKQLKTIDTVLHLENYSVLNQKDLKNGLRAVSINYFVKNKNANIDVFWFGYMDKRNIQFERRLIELISDDAIPKYCYSATTTDSVNFAGRTLKLGGNCNWMNVNNIQCPYHGQMDWSLHNTKESADASIQNQLMATKLKNGGKVVSEEMIDIIFEGVPTKAKKVHYDFTGLTSLLASTTGGKYLTIFYVSEKVRGLYLTCVLSFWNNDIINPSGLPALLEEVMAFPEN